MTETELNRIRWRSRRGLLELDLVLEKFLANGFGKLSEQEVEAYKDLLLLPDNDLHDLVNGTTEHADQRLQAIVRLICNPTA